MREIKPMMNFMWGTKQMRRVFFCGFELCGAGGVLLLAVIAASVPVVMGLCGMEAGKTVLRWTYGLAFVFLVALQEFLVEIPMVYGRTTWKGLGGIPYAKEAMTKGILLNSIIYFWCGMLLLLGIQGIGILVDVGSVSLLDDGLFLFGLFYFLKALFLGISCLINRLRRKDEVYMGISVIATVTVLNLDGEMMRSLPMAIGLLLAFFIIGTGVMYPVLVKCYENRGRTEGL